ncbi:MAG TPA: S8 family serine peptidase, partial [Acidimicrobiales bacterium]|nr:S8 family serine peptidase [Acidimicrobiales bacterium]
MGPRTSVWPARLGGPGAGGGDGESALDGAAQAAQVGEVVDDPAEVPPDLVPGAPDADLLQRAEDARAAEPPETPKRRDGGSPEPVADPDTLLVLFDDGASHDEIAAALDDAGVEGEPIDGIAAAEIRRDGRDADDVETAFEDDPLFTAVEPNLIRSATATPNDPQMGNQRTALETIDVPAAWNVADRTAKVTVAVLDTGVDLDHPDLRPNLVAGRDIVHNDASPGDDDGHGTMTAGLIGAVTDNGIGIAGVAWNARIMPVKVLDGQGNGTDAQIASGIVWATDHGAKVINMSLGGVGSSATLDNAVRYARTHDVVVVAAAGNDGSTIPHYPAAAPGVIGVTATDARGNFAWFSDHGPWISLAAPGIDVRTTTAAAGAVASTGTGTGTSFSSPLVAGTVALLRERHTAWSAARVAAQLTRTARDAGPAGLDNAYGYGIVDAAAALGVAPQAPVAPPPDRTGDAGNFVTEAELISDDLTVSETIGYEFDEDWFAFDVPAPGLVDIVVGSPPLLPDPGVRAHEFDAMFEVFAPNGLRVGPEVDAFLPGETEGTTLSLAAGRHTVRVRSWLGSAGPEPYQLFFDLRPTAAASSWTAAATVDGLTGPPATGDFDADGDVDVATGTDESIGVAWNEGGELAAPESYPASGAASLAAVDLDGASAHPATELVGASDVWRWTGDGFAATPLGFDRGSPAAGGDLNGDGRLDLVDVSTGKVQVHAQQAGGTWAEPTDVAIAPLTSAGSLAVGDVSADGHADLVVTGTDANGAAQVVRLLQAGGTLGEATALTGADGAGPAKAAAIGDVDGDGRADVAVLHDGKVGVYSQSADGRLGREAVLPAPDAAAG